MSHGTQTSIASYFARSPAKRKRRASSPIDLTGSGDEADSSNKSRLDTLSESRYFSPGVTAPESSTGTPHVERWRFDVSPSMAGSVATDVASVQTDSSTQMQRRERLKKLLLQNSSFIERTQSTPATSKAGEFDEGISEQEGQLTERFEALNTMFSNTVHSGQSKKKFTKTTSAPTRGSSSRSTEVVGPSGEPYTPLEKQVLSLKRDNPGTVLMIEVGYKYKFFGEDAQIAAQELGMIAFQDRNFQVASIPVHRRDVHLKKLLSQGYRVGIVSQTETAALKKVSDNRNAPFTRRVTQLYTAATYVENVDSVDDLDGALAPSIMCLIETPKSNSGMDVSMAMVCVTPSTGDVVWDDFEGKIFHLTPASCFLTNFVDSIMRLELETRLVHIKPAELLVARKELSNPTSNMLSHFSKSTLIEHVRIEYFDNQMSYTDAFDLISKLYETHSQCGKYARVLPIYPLENAIDERLAHVSGFPGLVVTALAHVVQHLGNFNLADCLFETKFFAKFTTRIHMLLGANTLVNLEVHANNTDHTTNGSLFWILDKTKTKFGSRLLRTWVSKPLTDKSKLQERIDAVEEIVHSTSDRLVGLRQVLSRAPDLAKVLIYPERLNFCTGLCRIQYGQCTPKELAILIPAFKKIADEFGDGAVDAEVNSGLLNDILSSLPPLASPIRYVYDTLSLKHAADADLENLWLDKSKYPVLEETKMALQSIESGLEEELKSIRKLLKMPSLAWKTVKDDEYLVEVKISDMRPIPDTWLLHSKTKFMARYYSPTVRRKLEERQRHIETLEKEARNAYLHFLKEISENFYAVLRNAVTKLAVADCLISLAQVALKDNYVRPHFVEEDMLKIVNGRHPMIEELISDPFIPNTLCMGSVQPKSKVITGPNMGGKSSSVRMVALIAIMAQIGCYVPAESVEMSPIDSVLTRMGASDDLAKGRSTFMMEMSETSDILHTATEKSLVILDELGRGTSTFDGMAIASATLQHLTQRVQCKTLFITHYHVVAADMASKFPEAIHNLHMAYQTEGRSDGTRDITFLYRLTEGITSESFGVECGRLAGLPEPLLRSAAQSSAKFREQVELRAKISKYVRLVDVLKLSPLLNNTKNAEMCKAHRRLRYISFTTNI
ncbi:hypothetical protein FISHEDRAFT_38295 [Fistulina hepatica ATCC 64428]|nr:hypothetical protein FISHEDRAFT_38295 [Fistulina hepatica ATCC 64428]